MRKIYLKQLLFAAAVLFGADVYAQCPTITLVPNQTVCSGMFSLSYTATTGTPTSFRIHWLTGSMSDVLNTGFTSSPTGGTINLFATPAPGTYDGVLYVRNISCESVGYSFSVTFVASPDITMSSVGNVCPGTSSTTMGFTTIGSPDKYSIDWLDGSNPAPWADVPLTSLPASPLTITNIPAVSGWYYGTITAKNSTTGCSTPKNIVVIVGSWITLGASPNICIGSTTASLPYTTSTLGANEYRIDWQDAANSAGFTDLTTWTTLPAGAITLNNIPSVAGAYYGNVFVRNSVTGCEGPGTLFGVTIGPSITPGTPPGVCSGSSSVLYPYTSTYGSPTQYRIDWDIPSGITDVGFTNLPGSPIIISNIPAAAGVYNGSLIVRNAAGCESLGSPISVTVSLKPSIFGMLPGTYCQGSTTSSIPYSSTMGSPTNYRIDWLTLTDVPSSPLPASPIPITGIPSSPLSFSGNLYVSKNGCESNPAPIQIMAINNSASLGTIPPVCTGTTSSTLTYSATSANQYRIDWDAASMTDVPPTTLPTSPIPINNIPTAVGTYTGTIYFKNSLYTCAEKSYGISVTVNPIPGLSSSLTPPPVCSGSTVSYVANSATTGATFSWSRANVTGISPSTSSGAGNVSEILTNATPAPIDVTYVYTTTANGCSSTQNVVQRINPKPVLSSSLTPPPVCSGSPVNYTATSATSGAAFSWSRAAVGAISPSTSSGSGNVTEVLTSVNSVPRQVTYLYSITANTCFNQQNVVVTVNPDLSLNSPLSPQTCSGVPFTYAPTAFAIGATFTWNRPAVFNITPATASGTGSINETLINSATGPVYTHYMYTISANSCSKIQDLPVLVKPTATLSSTLNPPAMCSSLPGGGSANYTPTCNIPGATFTWIRAAVPGITPASSAGTNSVSEWLFSSNADPTNVSYVYTISATNACTGTSTVNLLVKPTPVGTTPDKSICSGESTNLTLTTGVNGTTYTWTLLSKPGTISGTSPSGTSNPILHTLVNSAATPGTVVYRTIPTANSCLGPFDDVSVVVNPKPVVSVSPTTSSICTLYSGVNLTASGASSYTWSPTTGLSSTTSATVNANPPNNVGGTTTMTYTVTGSNGSCTSTATATVDINYTPTTSINPESSTTFCEGNAVRLNAWTEANVTFQWYRNGVPVSSPWYEPQVYTATTSGDYYLTITSAFYPCSYTTPVTTVTVNSAPQPYISGYYDLCSDGFMMLTANAAYGVTDYLWSTGETSSYIYVYYPGDYSVVANYGSCSSAPASMYINGCSTGCHNPQDPQCVEEARKRPIPVEEAPLILGIYPNPANNEVSIQVPEPAETDLDIKMYSSQGYQVGNSVIPKGQRKTVLDSKNLTNGIYIVMLTSPKGLIIREKLIIQH